MSNTTYSIGYVSTSGKMLYINSLAACGKDFQGIAIIHDCFSANPVLELTIPLGIDGVKKIIALVEQYRAEHPAQEAA